MRAALLWGLLPLLPLLCQLPPSAQGHSLGRSATDVEQLKAVLQRLEASLSAAPEDEQEPGDDGPDPEIQRGVGAHSLGGESEELGLRGLLDLLQGARRSGCFGARMDRIGNASGLGCGRG